MSNPILTLHISKGEDIKIEIFADKTPLLSEYFLSFFKKGYYNGLSFHTCVKDEYIQLGYHDLNGYGVYADDISDESEEPSLLEKDEKLICSKGTFAAVTVKYPYLSKMQLAILFTDQPVFSSGYEIIFKPIGHVISGYDYAKNLSNVNVDSNYSPVMPIILDHVSIS